LDLHSFPTRRSSDLTDGENEATLYRSRTFCFQANIACCPGTGESVARSLSDRNRCSAPSYDRYLPISKRCRTCGDAVPGCKVLRAGPWTSSLGRRTPRLGLSRCSGLRIHSTRPWCLCGESAVPPLPVGSEYSPRSIFD